MKKPLSDTDVFLRSQLADDPHKEIKVALAEFLLALIQAFLRTGYYTPDHPESQKAKVGLYEDFQNLFTEKNELTFLVREEPGGKNILIEGVLPEIQDLNSLMIAGMAEMYVPRFAKFLENKDLLSLTLKNSMTPEEFTNFVDLMGEPTFVDTHEKEDKERFSKTLQERNIFNISYIYNEELLAKERNIHWRSQIALTRLKKDFSMVPLYMDLDLEGMQKVRRQIIQDVFRPFRNAEAIYSVLLNSDLAETEEFTEADIDEEIIDCLSDDLLLKVAKVLTKGSRRQATESAQAKQLRLARQFASSLNNRDIKEREAILQEYVKHKFISIEHLPKDVQRKIRFEQLTKKIVHDSKSFFVQLDKIEDSQQYFRVARVLTKIIPELLRRDQYDAILKIVIVLDRHYKEQKDRSTYAGQILDQIGKGEIMETLTSKFLIGKKEICQTVSPIFLKLGERSVSQLVLIMERSNDYMVRKTAGDLLAQIDPSAMNSILNKLNKKQLYTGSTVDLLRVLGEIECDEWKQPLTGTLLGYLNNENPHLRVEALKVYFRIKGAEGKTLYHDFLDDKDIGVQKEAILCLAKVKSESSLGKFIDMLEKSQNFPPDKKEQIEACLFRALGFYGNVELPNVGTLEDFLLANLDRQVGSGRLKLTAIRKKGVSPEVIAAICESLGNIGTNKSGKILQKLNKQKDTPWQRKAEGALRKIGEREESKS